MNDKLFLTYEDRMSLLQRAKEDTNNVGTIDYYGQLIEIALMYPHKLEELKSERNIDIEMMERHGPAKVHANYLRIVQ